MRAGSSSKESGTQYRSIRGVSGAFRTSRGETNNRQASAEVQGGSNHTTHVVELVLFAAEVVKVYIFGGALESQHGGVGDSHHFLILWQHTPLAPPDTAVAMAKGEEGGWRNK